MTQPPEWVNDYIGLPFLERGRGPGGWDCWGLVRLVLFQRFGVAVPSYADGYEDLEDHDRLAAAMERGKDEGWVQVADGREQTGDVLQLRMSGLPIHVGLLVAPGWMLHTRKKTGAGLERLEGLAWRWRILGFYRYQGSDVRDCEAGADGRGSEEVDGCASRP